MLNGKMDELFELFHSPLVTPFNLLENIALDNYVSIKYCKENSNILADIVFLAYNEEITYRYVFDKEYYLQKIFEVRDNELIEQFCRESSKDDLYKQLKDEKHKMLVNQ